MSRLRRVVRFALLCVIATVLAGVAATTASASTFYVSGAGSDTNPCTSPSAPCKTIDAAVTKSELSPDAATIEVAAGIYTGVVLLVQAGDSNITINGAGSGTSGTVILESAADPAVIAATPNEGSVTLRHLRMVVASTDSGPAAVFDEVPYVLEDVAIEMQDSASTEPAIVGEERTGATLDHVSVGGSWKGVLLVSSSSTSIVHSSLLSNVSGLILDTTFKGGDTDLIQDSTVQSSSNAANINIQANGVNLTVDSSLLLGGNPYDIDWVQTPVGKPKLLTVASSTLDAGLLGVNDNTPVRDIFAATDGPPTTPATVQIEGSILLEQQLAVLSKEEDQLTMSCSYSDVPSQKQTAKGTEGSINCANSENGNTTSTPASLFVAPGTNYNLKPTSSAVDSVPAGAIALPFGMAPSPTDLAGNPRIVDGNGDCIPLQDKGALELQGRSAPCPSPNPPAAKPLAASITGLSISPSAFFAAPSGATISRTKKAKSYGTTISYKDSQIATTTFTVLKAANGRTQGKACKKPSKANRHGKRCTIYTAIGSFIHNDAAGANKLHFSGRIKGKKLAKGSYKLQAVPHDAAGNGAAVSKQFEIK